MYIYILYVYIYICVYMHICIYINNKYLLFMYGGGGSGLVAKSCLTLVTPSTVCHMYGPIWTVCQAPLPWDSPGKWVAMPSSRGSSQPRD